MAVVARISAIWSKQKLFVALFFLGLSLWFYFDAAVKYPRYNRRWAAYHELEKANQLDKWTALADEKGWIHDPPTEKPHSTLVQYIFGGFATIGGTILFIYWLTQRKRMLKMEDGAVFTPSGARVPFSSIRGLGKKRWESKGIAVVRYEDNGRLLQFIVDDYKYETEPTRQIVDVIEQHLLAKNDTAA